MNLLFRVFWVMIRAFFRKPLSLVGESIVRFRVWPTDLDLNMHMTNSRYLSMMDLGRLDLILRSKARPLVLHNKWKAILGASNIRFRRALNPFQAFELRTKVVGWDAKWLYIEQKFYANHQLVAIALVKGLFLDQNGSVPTEMLCKALDINYGEGKTTPAIQHWIAMEEKLKPGKQEV